MAIDTHIMGPASVPGIKHVPSADETRAAVRRAAAEEARTLDGSVAPTRDDLERLGGGVLARLDLPREYLGFAMVAVDNAFWRDAYRAVPHGRRLLLLPKCLSSAEKCIATCDSVGLNCAGCGSCAIHDLKRQGESLGYQVIVAEGTSSVLMRVLEGDADAILGIACLDSLEKSFARIADLGIPHASVPLLCDGCVNTRAELELIVDLVLDQGEPAERVTRSYVPLLRESVRLFSPGVLDELLASCLDPGGEAGPLGATDAIALEWLRKGGKRFRPFFTLAAYAVARHGPEALAADADVAGLFSPAVRRIALAIEVLHKASLAHDDIEDDDAFRYDEPALHRAYGIGPALNVGDFLIGLGYRLVAGESAELGAACVADILRHLSEAHLELCRGQGADLLWKAENGDAPAPRDVLTTYALKTAPAFEVALASGLRAAGAPFDADLLKRYCLYLGEGYQVLNDLDDWETAEGGEAPSGRDVLAGRPTLLRAFAVEAGGAAARRVLAAASAEGGDTVRAVADVRALYESTGAFDRAERLLERLRERAIGSAEETESPALRDLLAFLARVTLGDHGRSGP